MNTELVKTFISKDYGLNRRTKEKHLETTQQRTTYEVVSVKKSAFSFIQASF